jgi:PHD/YefM family antitoxin component YafN of YafNO toxin-antitoxin module
LNIRVKLDELLPTKAAARSLPQALNRLESGDAEHLVLTTRNVARAVLITVERYEQLLANSGAEEPLAA